MHARNHGFALVTKDDDFLDLQALHGPPPVVTRLVLGNGSHAEVFAALLGARLPIEAAMLVIVYTHREPDIYRLVSSWKASKPQRKQYEKGRR